MIGVSQLLSVGWEKFFDPRFKRIGAGYDVATTVGGKSNPASIAILQECNGIYYARLSLLFKTQDPNVVFQIFSCVARGLATRDLRIGKLCVDATSERFFATILKGKMRSLGIPTELVVSSESKIFRSEKMNYKCYLGNLICNEFADGRIAIPNVPWAKDNVRQVYRTKGTFAADVDASGNHADYFDALKLARYALSSADSRAHVDDAKIGDGLDRNPTKAPSKNPLLKQRKKKGNLYV